MLVRFNKPFNVLCQFSRPDSRKTLADYLDLPGIYPAGRLDFNSEGLLMLTDDGRLQDRITRPSGRSPLSKTYLVQVDGAARAAQIERLRQGVLLKDGLARAAEVSLLARKPGWLWKRHPPVRARKNQPTCWLRLVLQEGRNRQVRRMTAAVGLPTLRLVRSRVGPWNLDGLAPGEYALVDDDTPVT